VATRLKVFVTKCWSIWHAQNLIQLLRQIRRSFSWNVIKQKQIWKKTIFLSLLWWQRGLPKCFSSTIQCNLIFLHSFFASQNKPYDKFRIRERARCKKILCKNTTCTFWSELPFSFWKFPLIEYIAAFNTFGNTF
jgi:hypothetical protein